MVSLCMLSCRGKCDFYKAIFIHCVDTRPLICTRQKTTFFGLGNLLFFLQNKVFLFVVFPLLFGPFFLLPSFPKICFSYVICILSVFCCVLRLTLIVLCPINEDRKRVKVSLLHILYELL